MLELAHASLLRIHLLEALVLGKLLGHLDLELILHANFLGMALSLQPHLVVLGGLELLQLSLALVLSLPLGGTGTLLHFLYLEIVAQVLDVLGLGAALSLLESKFLEDGFTLGLGLSLKGGGLTGTRLLLGSVTANHLVLVLFKLTLTFHKGALFVL